VSAAVVEKTPSARETRVLPLEFFNRPAATVARDLIGKRIVRALPSTALSFTITETEAYEGQHDLACHSAKGRTARTDVMFGVAGRFYVYRIYGLHWMLNIVTGDVNEAAAVLVRGVEGVNGPGRVAAALKIDSSVGGLPAVPASGLWFERPEDTRPFRVLRTPRIGIDYAGPIWAAKKLRFVKA
jgi:DNA-3-methyladenine glycosylase